MDTPQPIVCQYRWVLDELLKAHKGHWKEMCRRPFRILLSLTGVVFIVFAAWLFAFGYFGVAAIWVAAALWVFWGRGVIRKLLIVRHFRKRPDRDQNLRVAFAEDGVSFTTEGAHGTSEWRLFSKARKCREGYLLYDNDRIFHWIPNDGFDSEDGRERFEQLLRRKVPNYKVL